MSAIAGIIQLDGRPVDRATLERMQTVLTPYGRDVQNHIYQGSAAFLRTLLRTTPEDSLDRQPLVHAESGTTLLFDGRIDNRDELARALGLSTAETALMADSDLVLRACLRWDTGAVERLLGDFALACWQAPRRRLWLARDPLGFRPLYWHQQFGFFAFATMPKGLFAIPGVPKALCEETLHDYLCLLPMIGPQSFFKDIYRVEPGQWLVFEDGRVTTHRYHQFDPNRELKLSSDDEYVEAFGEHLDRAVACRLRAIGPIASELSSGFDSSTVTAIAARQLAASNARLLAYTAVPREGFDGPVPKGWHADEGPAAQALAARFNNIDHHLIRTSGISPLDYLEEFVQALDRPPLNPCNMVWCWAIENNAAQHGARTLLTGTLGNASISYLGAEYLPQLFIQGNWIAWWQEAQGLRRHRRASWRQLILQSLGPFLPEKLWKSIARRWETEWNLVDYSAIHPSFMDHMQHEQRVRSSGFDLSYRPWADGRKMRISLLNRFDNGDYNAATNASGLEMRDPTADRRLIEFCLAVPDQQYLRDGQTRWLLFRLMRQVLPPEILFARTKGYQAADWYETTGVVLPQIDKALICFQTQEVGIYLDIANLRASLDDWPESVWAQPHKTELRYRLKLLRGLSVGTFIRQVKNNNY